MTEVKKPRLLSLPDDMLRLISEFCDLTTRCAVTCTNSTALNSVLLGWVSLNERGSERFLENKEFRLRICQRVATPHRNLHLEVEISKVKSKRNVEILNSVRSVLLYAVNIKLRSTWVNRLSRIQTLTKLIFRQTQVSDLSAFAGLANLTLLYLWRTQVSEFSALAGLTNLTRLNLSSTPVSDVSAIAGLTKLTELYLSSTRVSDVSPLGGLTNLTTLYLYNTRVSDVSALAGLAKLRIFR